MNYLEAIRVALQSLWANKLRSVLTLLGVVIGVFVAFARFHLVPRGERPYPFRIVLVQLFSVTTTLTA